MILYVFDGNADLPSIDVKCLQMMALAKFMKMNIEIVKRTYKPYVGSELPELICERGSITDLEDFVEYLKFEAGSTFDLSDKNLIRLDRRFKPYKTMFQETLKPALINVQWSDMTNYCEKTRGEYSKISSFPLNYFVPNYLRNQALDYMENVYPIKARKEYFSTELNERAKEIIKLLSDSLGDSMYFNSPSPNEIDALIFGYLAVILKTEYPRLNQLQQTLREHKNLCDYVDRILNLYFERDELQKKASQSMKGKELNFESASWKSIVLVGLFAITTNLLYVMYLISEDEDEEDSDEE